MEQDDECKGEYRTETENEVRGRATKELLTWVEGMMRSSENSAELARGHLAGVRKT